jgi:hypothetical protein
MQLFQGEPNKPKQKWVLLLQKLWKENENFFFKINKVSSMIKN